MVSHEDRPLANLGTGGMGQSASRFFWWLEIAVICSLTFQQSRKEGGRDTWGKEGGERKTERILPKYLRQTYLLERTSTVTASALRCCGGRLRKLCPRGGWHHRGPPCRQPPQGLHSRKKRIKQIRAPAQSSREFRADGLVSLR